jgi:hypothetical protein
LRDYSTRIIWAKETAGIGAPNLLTVHTPDMPDVDVIRMRNGLAHRDYVEKDVKKTNELLAKGQGHRGKIICEFKTISAPRLQEALAYRFRSGRGLPQ